MINERFRGLFVTITLALVTALLIACGGGDKPAAAPDGTSPPMDHSKMAMDGGMGMDHSMMDGGMHH